LPVLLPVSSPLFDTSFGPAFGALIEGVDLDAWIEAGEATQGGMVGSASLEWPSDTRQELGLVIRLIDRVAENPDAAFGFSHTFYYAGNKLTADIQNMVAQMIVPFARDYIEYIKIRWRPARPNQPCCPNASHRSRPRARQNVLLELGYFVGRLGRSRVRALMRGDMEVPSDFGGVVYEPFDAGGAWKQALSREFQAAGFDIDWNVAMKP
jgi:hypothetical protein